MGVVTTEHQAESPIPPAKFFKVFIRDAHINMPKIFPQFIKSIELIEGDGSPGSIKKTNFADGTGYKYVNNKIDVLDEEKFIYNYTAVEGDPWIEGLEKACYESKMEASSSGGSIIMATNKYYPKLDGQLDMDKIKEVEGNAVSMLKAVEAHILANPDAY